MPEELKEKLKSPAVTTPLLVLFVITAMQLSRRALANLDSETSIFLAIGVIQLVTLALPCIVYYLLKGRKLSEPMYLLPRSGPQIMFILFGAMLFISGMLLIKFFYFVGGGTVTSLVNFYGETSGTAEGANHIEVILSLIVIPAFCEEFFFRGIVMSEYRKFGTVNAILASTLCFAMLHFSLENFIIYIFTGLLLGTVTAVSRSIVPSIALHLLSNTLSIYASDSFLRITIIKNGPYFIGFLLIMLTGVSLVLLLSRAESICYSYAEKPPTESLPTKSSANWTKVFLSPAFIVLAIAFLCYAVFL